MNDATNQILAAIGELKTELAEVRSKVDSLSSDVSRMRAKIDSQPDLRLLGH